MVTAQQEGAQEVSILTDAETPVPQEQPTHLRQQIIERVSILTDAETPVPLS